METADIKTLNLLKFSKLHAVSNDVEHFITTRYGCTSIKPSQTLNLSLKLNDPNANANREILSRAVDIKNSLFTFGKQVHQANVTVVNSTNIGNGYESFDSAFPDTDAMITNEKNACLVVLLADCAPVLFYDPQSKSIGTAHSGRMGVVNNISGKTLKAMSEAFNSKPKDIIVCVGPCISQKNYPITNAARGELINALGINTSSIENYNAVPHLSLTLAIKEQLLASGIREENMELSNICTYEHDELFFSERRDGAPTGRFGAAIMLKPKT